MTSPKAHARKHDNRRTTSTRPKAPKSAPKPTVATAPSPAPKPRAWLGRTRGCLTEGAPKPGGELHGMLCDLADRYLMAAEQADPNRDPLLEAIGKALQGLAFGSLEATGRTTLLTRVVPMLGIMLGEDEQPEAEREVLAMRRDFSDLRHGNDLSKATLGEMLAIALGTPDYSTGPDDVACATLYAAADDLEALWAAYAKGDSLPDLGGVLTRIQERMRIGAEVARRLRRRNVATALEPKRGAA